MHRCLAVGLASPGGPRRLGVGAHDLVPTLHERIEARNGELRRSHEDDAHGCALARQGKRGQGLPVMSSQEIEALSQALARLPGLGPRSARRAVLHLMKKRETALEPLLSALRHVADKLSTCSTCGNVDTSDPCSICRDPRRDEKMLCVVEEVADLWALDRSRLFPGRYHVLGGRLSALDGVRPEDLTIDQLVGRVSKGGIDEVVLAMNATLEGQTTAHYVAERLEKFPIRLSQLAHGLPVGGELDYLDEGTLAQALRARRPIA
jgi:recombination protein RecR